MHLYIFGRLKYMERRGSGFKKIINAYETQQNYKESLKPIFNSFNNDFILTLFNLNYSANVPQGVTDNVTDVTDNVTDNKGANIDEYIIKMIKDNPKISTSKIAEILNVSKRTILRHIDELKKKNFLRFVGEAKNGYWELL